MVTNDRVIGGMTRACAEKAAAVYKTFSQGELLLTDADSAEMAKLVENAYRDVNIAFANEFSLICEQLQLDAWEVIELANRHPRVNILNPGPGVGGHCIAVDPWFIVSAAPDAARLIRTAREVNDEKPRHVARQVIEKAGRFVSPTIACLGLAFKANIDDLRESPAVDIVEHVAKELPQVTVLVSEPHVECLPPSLEGFENVTLTSAAAAVEAADIVVLLVDHDSFKSFNRSMRDRDVGAARGLGVLPVRRDRGGAAPQNALLDHRPPQCARPQGDRGHRSERVDADQVHQRRLGRARPGLDQRR